MKHQTIAEDKSTPICQQRNKKERKQFSRGFMVSTGVNGHQNKQTQNNSNVINNPLLLSLPRNLTSLEKIPKMSRFIFKEKAEFVQENRIIEKSQYLPCYPAE